MSVIWSKRTVCCIVWMILIPYLLMAAYLFFSRWPETHATAESDWMFMGISVLSGGAGIVYLPISQGKRILLVLAYVPVGSALMFLFTMDFLGTVFGMWL